MSDTMLYVRSRSSQECHEEIIAIVDINTARTCLSRSAPSSLSVLPTPLKFSDTHPLLLTLLWPLLLLLPRRRLVLLTESVTPLVVPILEVTTTGSPGPPGLVRSPAPSVCLSPGKWPGLCLAPGQLPHEVQAGSYLSTACQARELSAFGPPGPSCCSSSVSTLSLIFSAGVFLFLTL